MNIKSCKDQPLKFKKLPWQTWNVFQLDTTNESLSNLTYKFLPRKSPVAILSVCEFSIFLSLKVALTCTQIWWTSDVGMAFSRMEEGYDNALKEYYRKQVSQLNALISMLIGQLTPGERQKIMTICTIDVHARDVVAKMIAQKVS